MPPDQDTPLARDDPPWGACGDRRSPDFGYAFVWRLTPRITAITYDRHGRLHALTLLRGQTIGDEIVLQGRRFATRLGDPAERPF